MRFWAVPVRDDKTGQTGLWVGGSTNRNRDAFEQRFAELVEAVEKEVRTISLHAPSERTVTTAAS
jgi:hypothetical protein